MKRLIRFLRSFRYAGAGIAHAVQHERNLRVHLTAAVLAHLLGLLAELPSGEMAVISLCCGLVIGLELMNTAVEAVCDKVSPQRDPLIRIAKDTAAGAVLAAAGFSVLTAVWLFGGWILSGGLWTALRSRPVIDACMAAVLIGGFFFIRRDGPPSD